MIRALLRMAMHMLTLAGCLYVIFFVPVGERTLYEHGTRIIATSEAQELVTAVEGLLVKAKQAVAARL